MKIAVVGCGAVGSFYGANLARAGQEVYFLLRSDYEAVRRNGVLIRSPQGDFKVHPKCARTPGEIGPVDLVLVGLKTTANDQFPRLLPPLVSERTAVLTLQNGLGNEEQLARLFPADQIMGGLCFVCLNRIEPGIIHHLDHGLVIVGEFSGRTEPRTHEIATLFQGAGIPCKVTANLAQAHWEKLAWNIPFNGLGVAGVLGQERLIADGSAPIAEAGSPGRKCLTTEELLSDERWTELVRELMVEVITVARALGLPIKESLAEKQIARTRTMGAYKASTVIDFEKGMPLELEALFLEPLRQARKAGVQTPRLEALVRCLELLSPKD